MVPSLRTVRSLGESKRFPMYVPTIVVDVMAVRSSATMPPTPWLAPISRPIVSIARPFVPGFMPELAYATDGLPVVGTRRIRDGGGLLPPPISDTYSASPNQTGPSMIPKLLPLLLKLSNGGTPVTFVSVMFDGFGAVNGPAGHL